jgi:CRP-like cAMP-binding protein
MAVPFRRKAGCIGNRLLDKLPLAEFNSLAGKLEVVHLPAHKILVQAGDPLNDVYFPVSAILSLVMTSTPKNGRGVEIATIGNDGAVGFTALLGVPTSLHQATCQVPGDCLRLPVTDLAEAMVRRPVIDALMKRYVALAYRTALQAVICNTLHSVEQRICRWLLVMQERAGGEFPATHDFLATILGVKRPTISVVAHSLQKAGFISYRRGLVRIANRAALEKSACECYAITKTASRRIMEG